MRIHSLAASSIAVVFFAAASANPSTDVRRELEEILALDQTYRAPGNSYRWSEVANEQERIDQQNLGRLMPLLEAHGWPRISDVGEDAALGAFLVLQHADIAVQERFLPVIASLFSAGEAKGAWLALLSDRIRVRKGLPQIYGTQTRYNPASGTSEPLPVEDPGQVNTRRLELGLKPLSRYSLQEGSESGR